MSEGVVVFERRIGAARWSALTLLALSVPAALGALHRWERPLLDALGPISEAFGRELVLNSVIAVALLPLVLVLVAIVTLSRRFGRCLAGPDWLVFERALLPTWVGRTVALRSELHDREPRPGLVRVWLRGQRKNVPFIVPTSTQAELEAALLELDRKVDVEPVAGGRHHGRRDRWAEAGVVIVFFAFAVATMLVLDRRLGEPWALPSFLVLLALSAPLMLCLSAARAPRIRRVYVGRSGLAVGEELFGWDQLTSVGVGEGHLACAAGRRTCLAFIGADEGKVRDAIAARLAERGRPVEELVGPLPAGDAGWRRRVGTLALAAPALLVPVGVLFAACVVPNCVRHTWTDVHGQTLHVVYARDEVKPTAIVLVAVPSDGSTAIRTSGLWGQTLNGRTPPVLTVDLRSGEARGLGLDASFTPQASFVVASHQGVVGQRPVWQETPTFTQLVAPMNRLGGSVEGVENPWEPSAGRVLEELAAGVTDKAVLDAALGWTTRRCFEVGDGAERLVWGVDRGRVTFVVRAYTNDNWRVVREGMGFEVGRVNVADVFDGPIAITMIPRVNSSFTFLVDKKPRYAPDPTLPTSHADLLEVRRRVLAGEPLADVLRR